MDYILNNIFNAYDFFLLEIFAIPEETRREYLNKLMLRKDAASQKNVRLVRYIYSVLDGNSYKDWNEDTLCKKLDITPRMLDCHKSRILKSMREFHFDWESRKSKIREASEGDEIDTLMEIGREMSRIGMIKEAKQVYFKAEIKINAALKKKPSEKNYLHLSDIYRRLALYYYYQRDARKFNLYKAKAGKLLKTVSNKKLLPAKSLTLIRIRNLRIEYRKLKFNTPSDKNILKSEKILQEILTEAEKIKDHENILFVLDHLGSIYLKLKKTDLSRKLFKWGYELSEKLELASKSILFETLLGVTEFRENNRTAKAFLKKVERNYSILKEKCDDYEDLRIIHYNYVRMLIFFNREESDYEAERFINNLILYSNKADAISKWYLELSDRLSSSIYRWNAVMTSTDTFELDIAINKKLLQSFEEMNYNTLIHYNKFYDPETLAILYLNQIDLEFWKGPDCNYENALYFIKKLERLIKTRHIGINPSWFISSKIGVNIFEDLKLMSKKDLFDKYFVTIKEFIDSITDEKRSFNIIDELAKLIFIARRVGVKRLSLEVQNLEVWLTKNHPEHMKAILNASEIENKGFRVA